MAIRLPAKCKNASPHLDLWKVVMAFGIDVNWRAVVKDIAMLGMGMRHFAISSPHYLGREDVGDILKVSCHDRSGCNDKWQSQ